MRFGVATYVDADAKLLVECAVKAEELGADSYLVTDHFIPGCLDVWSLIPYIAARTSRIRLGTCVTPIPLRPPAVLAKMIATSDYLSGGRAFLGVGAGWNKPEFEGFSKWYELGDRISFTRESLELMIKLWTEEKPVTFSGKFVSSKEAVVVPKPIQKPYPQLWFGTHAPRTLRMTGRFGDGWIPVGPRWVRGDYYAKPEKYQENKKIITDGLAKRGKSESEFVFSMLIGMTDTKTLMGEIESYKKAGMNYFTLGVRITDGDSLVKMQKLLKEITPSL
jgi:alkanesulfonate monooxygenase SsuD/methylene tetrahydromethanopterin reductase-like flavin-dependent oxidoreductase (luciferase family)